MAKPKKITKKVYLPKWQKMFVPPLMVFIWAFVTYLEFFDPNNTDKMGLGGYLFFSGIMFFAGFITFLMASGKLPAYVIEEEISE